MPFLRINATPQGPVLHGSAQSVGTVLGKVAQDHGPVVIMMHGYKYSPLISARCPHARIFHPAGWPAALGLPDSGALGIALGWHARGGLAQAYGTALEHARDLAQIISAFRGRRPVHLIAHSLGATLALAALPYLQSGDVGRIVLLSGAAHLGLARHALATPAGQTCNLFHVTSRENALFDRGFEHLIAGTGAIGRGIDAPQAMRLHIDCNQTLVALADLGYLLAPPQRRVCHWSSYTRKGVMHMNAALLNGALPQELLRSTLPRHPSTARAPWSLATLRKTRIMGWQQHGKGPHHEHVY